ncbi:MAG: hypothetical protein ACOY3I_07600 [Verrucomicrobiota bacterium]
MKSILLALMFTFLAVAGYAHCGSCESDRKSDRCTKCGDKCPCGDTCKCGKNCKCEK